MPRLAKEKANANPKADSTAQLGSGQLFYSTRVPVCLWFSGKNNALDSAKDARLFDGETELSLVA